jgi:XTP/dITP diphosphohydrolase
LPKLSIATSNQGKLREFQRLTPDAAVVISPIENFADLPAFEENAPTFAENSAGKALHYSRYTDHLVLADDSGLVVPKLGGVPGVHSARYAGPTASAQDRVAKLLNEMKSLRGKDRAARFVCVLSLARTGRILAVFSDKVEGTIANQPAGLAGFGYDPVFVPEATDPHSRGTRAVSDPKTFAQISGAAKDKLSHRARAFSKVLAFLAADKSEVVK